MINIGDIDIQSIDMRGDGVQHIDSSLTFFGFVDRYPTTHGFQ